MYRDFKKKIKKRVIAGAMSAYFENKRFTFKKLEGGYENASFLIVTKANKYVLRIYNAVQFGLHTRDENNILTELEFVEFLCKNKFNVPLVHKTKQGQSFTKVLIDKTEHFVILTDYIQGRQVKKLSFDKIRGVAKIQAEIHLASLDYSQKRLRKPPDPLDVQRWVREELANYKPPENRKLLTAKATEIFDYFDSKINKQSISDLPLIMIHGDLHLANLKFKGDEVSGIFDFDDVKKSIVADDIGSFLMDVFKTGSKDELMKKAKIYFSEYTKINPISAHEISLAILISARRRLVFKTIKFIGRWDDEAGDIKDFKKTLIQTRRVLAMAEDNDFTKSLERNGLGE